MVILNAKLSGKSDDEAVNQFVLQNARKAFVAVAINLVIP